MKETKNATTKKNKDQLDFDINKKYPIIDKHFKSNKACIGKFKPEWNCYVYTVDNKMVGILSSNEKYNSDILNLKLKPEDNMQLQDIFPKSIVKGYHMNPVHWSSIILKELDLLPQNLIFELIDESYSLVFNKLNKKAQHTIQTTGSI